LTGEREKGEAFMRHYKQLANDVTGHSRDPNFWKDKIGDWGKRHMAELDEDFDLDELYEATSKLPNDKAPGEDGIMAEWMKELLPLRREDGSLSSTSRMATIVLRLLNQIWRTG